MKEPISCSLVIKSKILLAIFLAAAILSCSAQPNRSIDSLQNILKTAKEDTARVKLLIAVSNSLWETSEFAESKKYADTALALSDRLNFKRGKAMSFHLIGKCWQHLDNYPEAIKSQVISLKLMEESGDKNGIADCYYSIGKVNDETGKNDEALRNYLTAQKYYRETGNQESLSNTYSAMGLVYWRKGNLPEAIKNHFAGLKISESIGYKTGMA